MNQPKIIWIMTDHCHHHCHCHLRHHHQAHYYDDVFTPLPTTQVTVAMRLMAVPVRAAGATEVI